jgi:outer membrane PBP1 activator LpoA protein
MIMSKTFMQNLSLSVLISISAFAPIAHAEILVLLPEHGVLAPAASQIKEGLLAAYYAGTLQPPLRFVDTSDQPMDILLAKEVNSTTDLVIGPLSRAQVGELVNISPINVPVLALNQVDQTQKNVWQFALAPDEDAQSLAKAILGDGISQLYVMTQPQFKKGERFKSALIQATKLKENPVKVIPQSLSRTQGLLVLGSSQWVSEQKLPHDRVYAPSFVFDRRIPLSTGIQFCDTPALLRADWPELTALNSKNLTSTEGRRLHAFGADAWQLALIIADHALSAQFAGRTGMITIKNQDIQRTPVCFRATDSGLVPR